MRQALNALALLAFLLLYGCASGPERPADTVHNINTGGSALAVSPDSKLGASAGHNGTIWLWNLADGAARGNWQAHDGSVNGLAFLADGRLISAGYDGRLVFWTPDGRLETAFDTGSPVTAFAASAAAQRLATGHSDGKVRLWDLQGRRHGEWEPHSSAVRAVALSADGVEIASSGTDGQVALWRTNGAPERVDAPPTDARTLAFSPDGSALYGAGWFKLFRWTPSTGDIEVIETDHGGIVNSIGFMSDGRLASISRQTDSAVLLLDPDTGQTLERLKRHDLCGVAVAPSPDGRHLITTSDDASVRIWHLTPGPDDIDRR